MKKRKWSVSPSCHSKETKCQKWDLLICNQMRVEYLIILDTDVVEVSTHLIIRHQMIVFDQKCNNNKKEMKTSFISLQKIDETKHSSVRERRGKVSVPAFQQSLLSQSGKGWLQKSKSVSVITKEEVRAGWNIVGIWNVWRKVKCRCERGGQRWKKYCSTDCTIGRPECSPTGNPKLLTVFLTTWLQYFLN